MSRSVAFHRAARDELVAAAERYESLRPNLGRDFIAEIGRCVALASSQPHQHVLIHGGIRRVVATRFPYSIYFRVEAQRIVVLAVFHGSRDPSIWQRRR